MNARLVKLDSSSMELLVNAILDPIEMELNAKHVTKTADHVLDPT